MSKRRLDAETGFPLAIANPTFLMRPAERGVILKRPYGSTVSEPSQTRDDTQFVDCQTSLDTEVDESLFFAFLMVMRAWSADRHDWDAFLACPSGQPTVWLDIGMNNMSTISRERILNILKICTVLLNEVDDRSSLASALRASRPEFGGDSIRERLRVGCVLETLRHLDTHRTVTT